MAVPRALLAVGAAVYLLAMAGYSAASIYYNPRQFPAATLGVTSAYAAAEGAVRIDRVEPAGPAARAGLREGDRIHAVNGRPLATAAPFWDAIDRGKPGATVLLSVRRPGDPGVPRRARPTRSVSASGRDRTGANDHDQARGAGAPDPLPPSIPDRRRRRARPARPRSPRVVACIDVRRVHRLRAERRGAIADHPPGAAEAAPRHVGAVRTDIAWSALLFLCELP